MLLSSCNCLKSTDPQGVGRRHRGDLPVVAAREHALRPLQAPKEPDERRSLAVRSRDGSNQNAPQPRGSICITIMDLGT